MGAAGALIHEHLDEVDAGEQGPGPGVRVLPGEPASGPGLPQVAALVEAPGGPPQGPELAGHGAPTTGLDLHTHELVRRREDEVHLATGGAYAAAEQAQVARTGSPLPGVWPTAPAAQVVGRQQLARESELPRVGLTATQEPGREPAQPEPAQAGMARDRGYFCPLSLGSWASLLPWSSSVSTVWIAATL